MTETLVVMEQQAPCVARKIDIHESPVGVDSRHTDLANMKASDACAADVCAEVVMGRRNEVRSLKLRRWSAGFA